MGQALMLMDAAHEVVCKAEIECPVPTAGKEIDIIRQLPLRLSFRGGPLGPGPEPMNTGLSGGSTIRCQID